MSDNTTIGWTDATWNPTRGCSLVSAGCTNCYAMRFAHRWPTYKGLTKSTSHGQVWTGEVRTVPEMLDQPLRWKRPRRIFVNSMSDLFHEDVPNEFITAVFGVMAAAMQHEFQVLTKRPQRMLDWFRWLGERGGLGPFIRSIRVDGDRTIPNLFASVARTEVVNGKTVRALNDPWMSVFNAAACVGAAPLPNVWLGVSVEDQATADERIPLLLQTPAAVRFLSCEPLLAPIDLPGFNSVETWCPICRAIVPDSLRDPHEATHGLTNAGPFDERRHCASVYDMLRWIIIGGESGPKARPFDLVWARDIIAQCKAAGVPTFMKQCGANVFDSDLTASGRSETIRLKDRAGADPAEWPSDLRVREFPR